MRQTVLRKDGEALVFLFGEKLVTSTLWQKPNIDLISALSLFNRLKNFIDSLEMTLKYLYKSQDLSWFPRYKTMQAECQIAETIAMQRRHNLT
jgi:hypothetical protein